LESEEIIIQTASCSGETAISTFEATVTNTFSTHAGTSSHTVSWANWDSDCATELDRVRTVNDTSITRNSHWAFGSAHYSLTSPLDINGRRAHTSSSQAISSLGTSATAGGGQVSNKTSAVEASAVDLIGRIRRVVFTVRIFAINPLRIGFRFHFHLFQKGPFSNETLRKNSVSH